MSRSFVLSSPMDILTRPMNSIVNYFDDFERDARTAMQPADGMYVTYETKKVYWKRETLDNGDVIHRRLTPEEVEAERSHSKEGNS